MNSTLALAASALWTQSALAAPACEELDLQAFSSLVEAGHSAVERADPEVHVAIVHELRQRIPCLSFAPPPRILAGYLVLDALAEFSEQGAWQPVLTLALQIRPGVDRSVGTLHPMARFTPQATSGEPRPLPQGVVLFVDGQHASSLPASNDLHLIQVSQHGLWRSTLGRTNTLDESWLTDTIKAPLILTSWGQTNITLGVGGTRQRRQAGWAEGLGGPLYIPNRSWTTAWPSAVFRGGFAYGITGLIAEVDVGLPGLASPVASHGQAAITLRRRGTHIGVGAGIGGSSTFHGVIPVIDTSEVKYQLDTHPLPFAMAIWSHHSQIWDAGLSAGVGPACVRSAAHLGRRIELNRSNFPLRIGASVVAQRGSFYQKTTDKLVVRTLTWRSGVEVGVAR